MVQKKAHKSKPKSQAHSNPKDGKELNAQLGALGLKTVQITADGNCLFRAVADQLEGNEEEHLKYRKMVVDYIEAHREDYEPFLEDDVCFDDYCKNMRETSTWAGHMELQVISLVTRTNICIHRVLSPRWHIQNFKSTEARCINLSYHNGEHYNSIRIKEDNGGGPAKSIFLEIPIMEEKIYSKDRAPRQRHFSKNPAQKKTQLQEESFEETGWDLLDDDAENQFQSKWFTNVEIDEEQSGAFVQEHQEMHEELPSVQMTSSKNGEEASSNRPLEQVQKVSRNKACPCGSKKKYKACCGAVMPHHRPQEVACSTKGLSNKARKQKLRNSKGTARTEPEAAIAKESLDMGFLCI